MRGIYGGSGICSILRKKFEFLDSLERYFTYFRTRFEEKVLSQKAVFKLGDFVRSKRYFCKTSYCTHKRTTAK